MIRAIEAIGLREDRTVQFAQLAPRFDAQLVHERLAGAHVGLECVGLPASAIERQHQLAVQALAQRMLGDQALQLGDQLGVPTRCQVGLDARLHGRQALLLQPRDLGLRERLDGKVGQRRTPP